MIDQRPTQSRAFSLVELLVTVAVISILLLLISQLFDSTRGAVSRGVALSDIIGQTRTMESQLDDDFKAMVGPHEDAGGTPWTDLAGDTQNAGGVLMIVYHVFDNADHDGDGDIDGTDAAVIAPLAGVPFETDQGTVYRNVVSCELVFVRERGDQFPISPAATNTYSPTTDNGRARYILTRYAHLKRTNRDGSPTNTDLGTGIERLGTEWILGRQALFLAESTSVSGVTGLPIHADGTWDGADVDGYGSGANAPPFGTEFQFAITDYCNYSLYDPNTGISDHGEGAIVGGLTPAGSNQDRRLWASLTETSYESRALINYTFATYELVANPVPTVPDPLPWQIAQMHPYFLQGVSDFVVEFAADIADVEITGTPSLNPDGDLDRHGQFPADVDDFGNAYDEIPAGGIVWYTHPDLANYPGGTNGYDSTQPLTFDVPNGYEPYVDSGDMPGGARDFAVGAMVWRHDDDAEDHDTDPSTPQQGIRTGIGDLDGDGADASDQPSYWPYLIRIRYRLHDAKGQIESSDGVHGIWFEHIVPVNRP